MKYIVYETRNLVNGKIYVGVHKTPTPDAFDGYFGTNKLLHRAIKKYGKASFSRKTLYEFNSPEEAYEKEKDIVDESFISREDTYNLSPGGIGNSLLGKQVTELGIGIHALTFEERSAFSKQRIANTPIHVLKELSSSAGKVGGKKCKETKAGIFGLSIEERKANAIKGNQALKAKGSGFFSSEVQRELGKKGGKKNKGFRWYNDGTTEYKYQVSQQNNMPFEEFISTMSFNKGRIQKKASLMLVHGG